jgi:flagellar protein FliS
MILSASPIELIRLLYQRAILSVRDARQHLAGRRIAERARSINTAYLVLAELTTSLNREEAPELSKRLAGLYAYMQSRLLEANLRQRDEPLADVLGLLTTLAEAWAGIGEAQQPAVPAASPWAQSAMDEPARFAISA